MPISSDELVQLALEMSGMTTLPADSTINVPGVAMNRIMFGIDIGAAELLLAKQLGCDGVIAHHPAGGTAVRNFPHVLTRHIDFMVEHGVPAHDAREAVQPLILRAAMQAHAANADHAPSVARLLDMPLMNMHLPLDELGRQMMVAAIERYVAKLNHAPMVQDAVDALMAIPELANADTHVMVPVGALDVALGRVAVIHGAGTNGGAAVAHTCFQHGVDTVIYIHCSGDEVGRLRTLGGGNLIVSGHIASDLIGINPYIAAIEERGVEVIRMSGILPTDAQQPSGDAS